MNTLDRQTILLDSAHKVIHLKNVALEAAELTIQAQDSAYMAKSNEVKECRNLNTATINAHDLEKITLKAIIKKLWLAVIGEALLIVLILI